MRWPVSLCVCACLCVYVCMCLCLCIDKQTSGRTRNSRACVKYRESEGNWMKGAKCAWRTDRRRTFGGMENETVTYEWSSAAFRVFWRLQTASSIHLSRSFWQFCPYPFCLFPSLSLLLSLSLPSLSLSLALTGNIPSVSFPLCLASLHSCFACLAVPRERCLGQEFRMRRMRT